MSARKLLLHVHAWLVAVHGEEKVYDLLDPPTYEELRAARLAQLRALGVAVNA